MANFRIVYHAQFLTDLNNLDLKIYVGYALFKKEKIMQIKQKNFLLLFVELRYFFGTPGSGGIFTIFVTIIMEK